MPSWVSTGSGPPRARTTIGYWPAADIGGRSDRHVGRRRGRPRRRRRSSRWCRHPVGQRLRQPAGPSPSNESVICWLVPLRHLEVEGEDLVGRTALGREVRLHRDRAGLDRLDRDVERQRDAGARGAGALDDDLVRAGDGILGDEHLGRQRGVDLQRRLRVGARCRRPKRSSHRRAGWCPSPPAAGSRPGRPSAECQS